MSVRRVFTLSQIGVENNFSTSKVNHVTFRCNCSTSKYSDEVLDSGRYPFFSNPFLCTSGVLDPI